MAGRHGFASQNRLPLQGRERQPRTHEFPLDGADQSRHRMDSVRLGEPGQGRLPAPDPEARRVDRFRPRSGDHRDQPPAPTIRCRRGEGGHCRHSASKRRGPATDDAAVNFSAQGGKGADQSWRRRLQEPQGLRPLEPFCGPPGARRPRRPRSGAQGPAQGAGGARPQVRRGDRSAEDRRHRVARAQSRWRTSNISSARPMQGHRARSASAFPPTA